MKYSPVKTVGSPANRKYRNIAISGLTGSGKSTLAKALAEKLGWKHISTGDYIRIWHQENNIPLTEPHKIPEKVDKELDFGYQRKMETERGVVFDSRLGGWLARDLPETLKILCQIDEDIAAERISKRDGVSIQQAKEDGRKRESILEEKFDRLYNAKDYLSDKYFDLVINTGKVSQKEALELVLEKMINQLDSKA